MSRAARCIYIHKHFRYHGQWTYWHCTHRIVMYKWTSGTQCAPPHRTHTHTITTTVRPSPSILQYIHRDNMIFHIVIGAPCQPKHTVARHTDDSRGGFVQWYDANNNVNCREHSDSFALYDNNCIYYDVMHRPHMLWNKFLVWYLNSKMTKTPSDILA